MAVPAMTRAGRGLYAVGGNPVAARYCGIDLGRQQFLAYAISGAVAGLCGYLWVARYGVAYAEIATGYELTVIAACVIGGVSIGGGIGTVAGHAARRAVPRRHRQRAAGDAGLAVLADGDLGRGDPGRRRHQCARRARGRTS